MARRIPRPSLPGAWPAPRDRGRFLALVVAVTLTAAACADDGAATSDDATAAGDETSTSTSTDETGSTDETTDSETTEEEAAGPVPVTVPQAEPSSVEQVPSALEDPFHPDFAEPLVDPDDLLAGGPPPDGIPAIDEPTFLEVDQVDFLEDTEPVLALEVDGEARAYPIQVMIWHEIVNDTIADVPVTVSYCPLCNSAIAYNRQVDDRVLDFGTSGALYNSALIMYDRQTESLWSHFTGEAVIGHLTGTELESIPVATVSWADFRSTHPDALVLSRETGYARQYGVNPYPGYDDVNTSPFLFAGEPDDRLAAKERVIGIERDGDAAALVLESLASDGVELLDIGGGPVVVWSEPGTASALEAGSVSGGRDVGATGAFVPIVDGEQLDFDRTDDGFEDQQTHSRWDVLGHATSGPLEGEQLEAVVHVDTFWFAWGAYQPDSRIID